MTYDQINRGYQRSIHEIDPKVNPAFVECTMRDTYGTLDALPKFEFVKFAAQARWVSKADQRAYMGNPAEFDAWEAVL